MSVRLSIFAFICMLFLGGAVLLTPPAAHAQATCPDGSVSRFGECGPPRPADDGHVYTGDDFQLTFGGCSVYGRQARCELWVKTSKRMPWHFTNRSYLATTEGAQLGVRTMTIAGEALSVWDMGYRVRFVYLEPEIRTRVSYTFDLDTAPDQIQAVLISVPRSRFAKFRFELP